MATVGRPRSFDADKALDAALEVFWRQGYEGTSVSHLTDAMGINRPAIYQAFQSKKALFYRAVDRYSAFDAVHTFAALREPTAKAVTEQYLRRSVEQLTDEKRPMGCFILRGGLVCGPENQDIVDHMAGALREAEANLRRRYMQAGAVGDLSADQDPTTLARYVATVRHGLAVMACSGTTRAELMSTVSFALGMMNWPTAKSSRRSG